MGCSRAKQFHVLKMIGIALLHFQVEAHARVLGVLPETLVNLWLAERITVEKAA